MASSENEQHQFLDQN